MIRIGVVGASGRTGRYVVQALQGRSDARLYAAVVSPSCKMLGDVVEGTAVRYSAELDALSGADVVIEFTTPDVSLRIAGWCAEHRIPVLVATTGHSEEQRQAIERLSTLIAVGMTPNTSVGAAVLAALASQAKQLLGESFDIEVLDIHHRMKKDAPSGTARAIVQPLAGNQQLVFGREGQRCAGEVGVVAIRGGDAAGDHTVYFLGDGERLELTHRVSTREVFGRGAVSLALKLVGLPGGVYSAGQLIGPSVLQK
jgi:4-hydroxy-tetrahydrodipicolinate reductase